MKCWTMGYLNWVTLLLFFYVIYIITRGNILGRYVGGGIFFKYIYIYI